MKKLFLIIIGIILANSKVSYSQSEADKYYGTKYKVLKAFFGGRSETVNLDVSKMWDLDAIVTLMYRANYSTGHLEMCKVIVQNEKRKVINISRLDSVSNGKGKGYFYYNIGKDDDGVDVWVYDHTIVLTDSELRKINTIHSKLTCITILRDEAGVAYLCEPLRD